MFNKIKRLWQLLDKDLIIFEKEGNDMVVFIADKLVMVAIDEGLNVAQEKYRLIFRGRRFKKYKADVDARILEEEDYPFAKDIIVPVDSK